MIEAENRRGARIRSLVLVHDGLISAVAFLVGLLLTHDGAALVEARPGEAVAYAFAFGVGSAGIMYAIGINRAIWRYASAAEIWRIGFGSALCVVLALAANSVVESSGLLQPRALAVTAIFMLLGIAGTRFLYRLLRHRRIRLRHRALEQSRVALVGPSSFITSIVRTSHELVDCQYDVAAAFDTDGVRTRRIHYAIPSAGDWQELSRIVDAAADAGRAIDTIMIDDQLRSITPRLLREIVDLAARHCMGVAWVPEVSNLRRHTVSSMPDKDHRLRHLFPSPVIEPDAKQLVQLLHRRTVVVVGAGLRTGTELAKRIALFEPARMLLIEANELRLHEVTTAVTDANGTVDVVPVIGSGRDRDAIAEAMSNDGADYVFIASMYGRRAEAHYDPMRTVRTDLIGVDAIADIAAAVGARALVFGSAGSAHGVPDLSTLTSLWIEQDLMRRDLTSPCRLVPVRLGDVMTVSHGFAQHVGSCLKDQTPLDLSQWRPWMTPVSAEGVADLMLQSAIFALEEGVRGVTLGADGIEPVETPRLARWIATLAAGSADRSLQLSGGDYPVGASVQPSRTQLFAPADDPVGVRTAGLMMARPHALPSMSLPTVVSRLEQFVDGSDEVDPVQIARALSDLTYAEAV